MLLEELLNQLTERISKDGMYKLVTFSVIRREDNKIKCIAAMYDDAGQVDHAVMEKKLRTSPNVISEDNKYSVEYARYVINKNWQMVPNMQTYRTNDIENSILMQFRNYIKNDFAKQNIKFIPFYPIEEMGRRKEAARKII